MTARAALALSLLTLGCAGRLHRYDAVPPATGRDAIEARVTGTATAADRWYVALAVTLRNPTGAAVEVDLADARYERTSMLDGTTVAFAPAHGGLGAPPTEPGGARPPRVTLSAGESVAVWIAFDDPERRRPVWVRRAALRLPLAGEIVLDEITPERPYGIRESRARRRAVAITTHGGFEASSGRFGTSVPWDVGAALLLGELRLGVHAGGRARFDDRGDGLYRRTSGGLGGVDAGWQPSRWPGLFGGVDYERAGGGDAAIFAVGASLPAWRWSLGRSYDGWAIPVAALRIAFTETVDGGGSAWGLRFGVEIAAPLLF